MFKPCSQYIVDKLYIVNTDKILISNFETSLKVIEVSVKPKAILSYSPKKASPERFP